MSLESHLGFTVLRRTPHDLIVIKPAGMPTEMLADTKGDSLIARVRGIVGDSAEPKLPHRLDRISRGVVLIALSAEAIAFYNESIRDGQWGKYYIARIPTPDEGNRARILGEKRAYLKRKGRRAEVVRSGGQPSSMTVLDCAPAPHRPGESHLLVQLHTGRYHQIRVMLANVGFPLVGDELYGGTTGPTYLEHVLLRFIDFESKQPAMAHFALDPDREPIAENLQRALCCLTNRA